MCENVLIVFQIAGRVCIGHGLGRTVIIGRLKPFIIGLHHSVCFFIIDSPLNDGVLKLFYLYSCRLGTQIVVMRCYKGGASRVHWLGIF